MPKGRKKDPLIRKVVLISIIFGLLSGGVSSYILTEFVGPSQEKLIKDFYDTENAVGVSPHGLRKHLGEDPNMILVDLRSQEEYEEEHITGAVNVPAYKDRDNSDYGAEERIVGSFSKLLEQNPNAEIIIHCYSIPCMTGRKIGKMLSDNGIYVKHLNVGWNEWRYDWTAWNHPHEWNITDVADYITTGPEPGYMDISGSGCPISGELGC